MIHKPLLSALKRHVNRISISWNPLPLLELNVEQERCFALENLTTSFAMSPIFFNHPNTTNSIKLINFLPIVLQDKQLHYKWMRTSLCCPCEILFNQQPKFYLSVLIYPIIAVGCFAMSNVLWRWAFHILYCFFLTKCCLDFCSFVKWNNSKNNI